MMGGEMATTAELAWRELRVLIDAGAAWPLDAKAAARLRFRHFGHPWPVSFCRHNGPRAKTREHAPPFDIWIDWPAVVPCDERREREVAA